MAAIGFQENFRRGLLIFYFLKPLLSFKWHNQLEMSYDLGVFLYHTPSLMSYPGIWELKCFVNMWLKRKELEKERKRIWETWSVNILFSSVPLAASFMPLESALILPCLSWMLLFGYSREWKNVNLYWDLWHNWETIFWQMGFLVNILFPANFPRECFSPNDTSSKTYSSFLENYRQRERKTSWLESI